MKKHVLFLLLAFALFGNAFSQVTYDDFENQRRVHYDFVHGVLDQYAANPGANGVNGSALCGEYARNAAEMFDVLVILPDGLMNDVSDYVSGAKTMSVKVYSPAAGKTVQVTLEDSSLAGPFNYPTGRHSVYLGTTTVANQWETITLTFDSRPDPTVPNTSCTSMILLFDPGANTGDTYFFDDIMGPEFNDPCASVTPAPLLEFEDFDCQRNVIYDYFDGFLFKQLNPATSGINPSKYAGNYTRNPNGDGDDVIVMKFSGPLDFSTNNEAKLKVNGPLGDVVIAMQDASGVDQHVATASISAANTWEELSFDFGPLTSNTSVEQAVILLNPGSTNGDVYWFDDFKLEGLVSTDPVQENNFFLGQNVPNPAHGQATIPFDLNKSGSATLTLTDLQGRVLDTPLQTEFLPAGHHEATINFENIAAGMYLYHLEFEGVRLTKKLIIN